MKKVGLFFGSFNPIHQGHLIIANKTIEIKKLEELWFVVSPQNPHKEITELLDIEHRVNMLELSISELDKKVFKICKIECSMPKPSYTIDTLNTLKDLHPDKEFSITMGMDSLRSIKTWKNYQEILDYTKIIVYNRVGYEDLKNEINEFSNVEVIKIPSTELSATFLRNEIKNGKSIKFMVPDNVIEYIVHNKLYI